MFFIDGGNFTPWNTSGDTSLSAIGGAAAICLFSYLGVEAAAVTAAKVRNPERNVPRATLGGTAASAVVYLLSMVAIFGILPAAALASDDNQASYAAATDHIFGGSWSGNLVAAAVQGGMHPREWESVKSLPVERGIDRAPEFAPLLQSGRLGPLRPSHGI